MKPLQTITVRQLLSHRSGILFSSSLETSTLDIFPLALRVQNYALLLTATSFRVILGSLADFRIASKSNPTIPTMEKNVHKPVARLTITMLLLVVSFSLSDHMAHAGNGKTMTPPSYRGSLPTEKDLNRHAEFMARKERLINTGGTQLVLIGDSITDGWRLDPQREIFEDYFGRYRPYNIGIGGDETQHVLWRIEHGELDGITPKVVVLLIGTNNMGNFNPMTPEETAEGITTLVTAIRHKLPDSTILLLGIFPRGNRPDDPFRAQITQTNALIAKLDDGRYVKYLDIGAKFLDPDGSLPGTVMPDYLHPNVRGYEIWAEAIQPTVEALEQ